MGHFQNNGAAGGLVSVNSPGIYRRSKEYEIIVRESKPVQGTPSQYHVVHRTAKYYVGVIHSEQKRLTDDQSSEETSSVE